MLEHITAAGGATGATLYAHFGGPPYGYAPEVVRACVAGLLRGSKIRIQSESGDKISAVRDAGVRDGLEKERGFQAAIIYPVGDDAVSSRGRARICKFFEDRLGIKLDRENDAIADRVSTEFPRQMTRLREVFEHLRELKRAQFDRDNFGQLVAVKTTQGRLQGNFCPRWQRVGVSAGRHRHDQ